MYRSTLLIDVGDNPDRPRPGRLWLHNLYHVHQRLCMAFPSAYQKERDPEFVQPYRPCGFPDPRPEWCGVRTGTACEPRPCAVAAVERPIHVERDYDHNFLFRVDPHSGGNPTILVQSALKPDWDYAFHNAGFLLSAPPGVKPYDPSFPNGQSLKFRLVANPTRKIDTKSGPDGQRRNGRRVPVKYELLPEWLDHQGERGGFKVEADSCACQPGYVYVSKPRVAGSQRLFSVRFDGLLRVTDADAFRETLIRGIGPAKAFGFGLLSVAPCQT